MGMKAAELAALLKDKNIFYVNIEEPDSKGSTIETIIEDLKGIICSVEADTITFKGTAKTAYFTILENTQILTHQTEECEIISTFAENGGIQIKRKKKI